jgi:hypothetical protein
MRCSKVQLWLSMWNLQYVKVLGSFFQTKLSQKQWKLCCIKWKNNRPHWLWKQKKVNILQTLSQYKSYFIVQYFDYKLSERCGTWETPKPPAMDCRSRSWRWWHWAINFSHCVGRRQWKRICNCSHLFLSYFILFLNISFICSMIYVASLSCKHM